MTEYHTDNRTQEGSAGTDTATLAAAITIEDHFAQDAGGKLYRFSDGTYKQHANRYIKRRVKHLLQGWGKSEKWTSHKASEVVEYIRADAPELWKKPPLDEVNVLNGILNVTTRKLRDHDPAFLSPVQIPVTYDPSAECHAWDKFVSEVFPEDAQELAYELAADLITPSRSSQKALLLLGEGSNGKSTYLRGLTAFVGSTNAAGVSLHKLESDRFATARLTGKLANICPDLPSTHLTETSVFKAIVGGDDLHAEYKYGESFEFQPYCRLVFSANHVPRSGDASHAFFRRWLVIPFDRTFEGTEQIPRETLDAKLSDERELSGVLNRALEVMERVRTKGFTESESMRKAWEEFKLMTDPVSVWLDRNTVTAAAAWCVKADLIAAYNKNADNDGRAGMTAQAFGRALKRARPSVEEAQKTINDRRVWCYTGIGLGIPGGDDTEPDGARAARDARDSTNCFVPDVDNAKVTSKEKRVQRVQGVQDNQQASFSEKRDSQQKSLSTEGKGVVVELQPDHISSSLPARSAPREGRGSTNRMTLVEEELRPDNGGPLRDEEVELFKHLRTKMRPDEARAEIMRRRERDGAA